MNETATVSGPRTHAAPMGDIHASSFDRALHLLGGEQHLGRVASPLDIHMMLLGGLPYGAVNFLFQHLDHLKVDRSLEGAVGFSVRTFQRRREAPDKPLTREQGGKVWRFAEILALAIEVMGNQDAAERWLESPVMALDRNRPIDLLATPAGTEMVKDLLGRLQYGVYT